MPRNWRQSLLKVSSLTLSNNRGWLRAIADGLVLKMYISTISLLRRVIAIQVVLCLTLLIVDLVSGPHSLTFICYAVQVFLGIALGIHLLRGGIFVIHIPYGFLYTFVSLVFIIFSSISFIISNENCQNALNGCSSVLVVSEVVKTTVYWVVQMLAVHLTVTCILDGWENSLAQKS